MASAFTVHELQRPTNKIATTHEQFFCRYERIFSSFFLKTRTERERACREGRGKAVVASAPVRLQEGSWHSSSRILTQQQRKFSRHCDN